MKRTLSSAAAAAAFALLAAIAPSPASAAGLPTLALYQMNEQPGSTQLVDSSGNKVNGTIGAHVGLNGQYNDFPYHNGAKGGTVDPEHLDLVDNAALNPGTRDFSVSLRLRFTKAVGNVLQKGQSGTVGGMFKLQLDDGDGKILCRYVSPGGSGGVWSPEPVNDGNWHVVTCTRTQDAVTITVDGTSSASIHHVTGDITNKMPLAIGGKSFCRSVPGFDCDYFDGQIDWLRISSPLPDGGPSITGGKVSRRTFYPFRRDGYRDRVSFSFRAGLQSAVPGGADVAVEIWNATRTRLVRRWTFHQESAGILVYHVRWSGRRRNGGRMVRPGVYRIRATISVPSFAGEAAHATRWRTVRARRGR